MHKCFRVRGRAVLLKCAGLLFSRFRTFSCHILICLFVRNFRHSVTIVDYQCVGYDGKDVGMTEKNIK